MGTNGARSKGSIKTIDRCFRILETLREQDGSRVSELADELDLANSTVHRYLQSLRENEYVVKEGDVYHLGMGFLGLGDYVRKRKRVYQEVEESVQKLADETNERAEFLVEEHGQAIFVHREAGPSAVQADSHLGKRLPMHATSAGKAILAFLPQERLEAILDRHGMRKYTENTITDRETLYEELDAVREDRFAYNKQEYIKGLNTVSVPVLSPAGQVYGALGISGPTHRLKGDKLHSEIPDLLLGSANALEINVSYP